MADLIDSFPLVRETPESIRARMLADTNAGIDPSDPLYADVLPGSVWDDMARADALEFDRLYDRAINEVPAAAMPGLATGVWLDGWADVVDLQRKVATPATGVATFTGDDGTDVPTGTQVSTEAPTPDADPITFQVTTPGTISGGSIDLPIAAVDAGSAGNVAANAVTLMDSEVDATVTNAAAISGGSDVETDEQLQGRVTRKLKGTNGAGNQDYYLNIALNEPGVGFATIEPNTPSLGHVKVSITDSANHPFATTTVIDSLQAKLDPSGSAAQGAGLSTIGATVVVSTPTTTAVAVSATLVLATGYSIDGAGGTIALRDDITAAVARYFAELGVGDDVVHNKILAAIIDGEGVLNVSALTPADTAIAADHLAVLTLPLTLA